MIGYKFWPQLLTSLNSFLSSLASWIQLINQWNLSFSFTLSLYLSSRFFSCVEWSLLKRVMVCCCWFARLSCWACCPAAAQLITHNKKTRMNQQRKIMKRKKKKERRKTRQPSLSLPFSLNLFISFIIQNKKESSAG